MQLNVKVFCVFRTEHLVWIIKNNTCKFILDLISQGMMVSKGILSEDGKLITSWGMWNDIEYLRWMSDEDLKVW